jgi:hypothetical protein
MVLTFLATLLLQSTAVTGGPQPSGERAADAADPSRDDSELAEADHDPSVETNRSFRSGPPDTTPYTRPIVPEDYAPGGKPAIPPGVTVPAPDESLRKKTDDESDGGGNEYKRRFLSTTT